MTNSLGRYLTEATACQAAFALGYWLLLARLTAFRLSRAYLLAALLLSVLLPLVPLPAAWATRLWPTPAAGPALAAWRLGPGGLAAGAGPVAPAWHWQPLLLAGYWLGVAYCGGRTARSLLGLYRLSRRHPRTRQGASWLVRLPMSAWPAFSFGRYIFLGPAYAQLSAAEQAQLLAHEQAHGRQAHSLDVLLGEVLGWFFWFNGLVWYLSRQLRLVHEYLADAAAVPQAGGRSAYGHLLLKLAAGPHGPLLTHPFATRQVAQRLRMLTAPPSSPAKQLRFLLVVPLGATTWAGTAWLAPRPAAPQLPAARSATRVPRGRVGTITWQGNTWLSAEQLTQALGLQPGDTYDAQVLAARLGEQLDGAGQGTDITSRYLDNGYLYFNLTPVATSQPNGTTNLLFRLSEGPTVRLGAVRVRGNRRVPTAAVVQLTGLRSGELFSRAKLVAAQRSLAGSGQFVPASINVNPQPVPNKGLVDIEFVVTER